LCQVDLQALQAPSQQINRNRPKTVRQKVKKTVLAVFDQICVKHRFGLGLSEAGFVWLGFGRVKLNILLFLSIVRRKNLDAVQILVSLTKLNSISA
jgi:hypothetical protein